RALFPKSELGERREPAVKRARVEDERPLSRHAWSREHELASQRFVVGDDGTELVGLLPVPAETVAAYAVAVAHHTRELGSRVCELSEDGAAIRTEDGAVVHEHGLEVGRGE